MSGETDLQKLLQNMKPKLNTGEYVFCTMKPHQLPAEIDPLSTFQEAEGTTVIITRQQADDLEFTYPIVCSWITLTVHSSLEAVGLTAAISEALTRANISCNVVAAYYHDHIFVPVQDAQRAMDVLEELSTKRE